MATPEVTGKLKKSLSLRQKAGVPSVRPNWRMDKNPPNELEYLKTTNAGRNLVNNEMDDDERKRLGAIGGKGKAKSTLGE
jgi:hypothetical protein